MSEIKVFENAQLGAVRTVMVDGEPWFVGKEVCGLFGDTNHNRSLSRVDLDDKITRTIDTAGGAQPTTLINESGLYALLFALQPQKANKGVSDAYPLETQERIEKLHAFKRWITHDVIPDIRKHVVRGRRAQSWRKNRRLATHTHVAQLYDQHGRTTNNQRQQRSGRGQSRDRPKLRGRKAV